MTPPFLTVLTTPILSPSRRTYQTVRRTLRPIVKPGAPPPATNPYPGHSALVRSVVDGLRAIDASFNYNPRTFGDVGRAVYAPANEALRQAAAMKREKRIDLLVAGPVNALFPAECDAILRMPEIDLLIVPSDWVVDLYRGDAPELEPKIRICQAGVDPEFWRRSSSRGREMCALVYWKNGPESLCRDAESLLARRGFETARVRYGSYSREQYKTALDRSRLAVFLSTFETQGLALAEAWAMDVPTLAWNPCGEAEWKGRRFRAGSSCPFLTEVTGRAWMTLPELERGIEAIMNAADLRPRQWVLSHMTDAVCASALYRIIQTHAGM